MGVWLVVAVLDVVLVVCDEFGVSLLMVVWLVVTVVLAMEVIEVVVSN